MMEINLMRLPFGMSKDHEVEEELTFEEKSAMVGDQFKACFDELDALTASMIGPRTVVTEQLRIMRERCAADFAAFFASLNNARDLYSLIKEYTAFCYKNDWDAKEYEILVDEKDDLIPLTPDQFTALTAHMHFRQMEMQSAQLHARLKVIEEELKTPPTMHSINTILNALPSVAIPKDDSITNILTALAINRYKHY